LKCYAGKIGAFGKSHSPNTGNTAWYDYAGKVGRVKSATPNAGNAAPDGYAGKTRLTKSVIANDGNAVRYSYAGKIMAIFKSAITNAGNIVEIALNNSCWRFAPVLILYPVRN